MNEPTPTLISIIMDGEHVCAYVATDNKDELSDIPTEMKYLRLHHPIFSNSRLTWCEATDEDRAAWKNSKLPTILI